MPVEGHRNDTDQQASLGHHVNLLRIHLEQSRIRQKKIVNQDGSMGFQEENVLSLTYPFQVMHDPNPKLGAPWLKKMLAQPV